MWESDVSSQQQESNASMTLRPDQLFLGACLLLMGVLVGSLSLANCVPVSKYFLFLNRFWGRGGMYLFLGVLCLNGSFWRILLAAQPSPWAIVYLLYSCAYREVEPRPLSGCTLCDKVDDPRAAAPGTAVVVSNPANGFQKEAAAGAPRAPFREEPGGRPKTGHHHGRSEG